MYKSDIVTDEEIQKYIAMFQKSSFKDSIDEEIFFEMEEYAKNNNVPIVKKDVANFLLFLINLYAPKKILEVGTAIGYSSLLFASVTPDSTKIDTIEINEDIIPIAKGFLDKTKYTDKINIIKGDALEKISDLDEGYDFVFIDGPKSQYGKIFKEVKNKLSDNFLVICDNVLFRGLVCTQKEKVQRRKRTICNNLNKFLNDIQQDITLYKDILYLGDGLLLVKNKKQ